MIKRILIIGFGMMGKSHLYSFINSKHKYQISIYDKKNYSKIEISNYFNKVNFLKKFPKMNLNNSQNLENQIICLPSCPNLKVKN